MTAHLQQLNDDYRQRRYQRRQMMSERRRHVMRHALATGGPMDLSSPPVPGGRRSGRGNFELDYEDLPPLPDRYQIPDRYQVPSVMPVYQRTFADSFLSRSSTEATVASSIAGVTYRIQRWDLHRAVPEVFSPYENIVLRSCKLHNDATADISQDGRFLATFMSTSTRGARHPDETTLGVFSLQPDTLGQCLYTKSFGKLPMSVT